jgi:peptidyl-prolyl cis-trans isomerase B (cyclophilin B)
MLALTAALSFALTLAPAKTEAELQQAVDALLAASKDKGIVVAIAADREKAALGDEFVVEVGLQNKGEANDKVKDLALDAQSIAFEIDWNDGKGKPFLYTETHERYDKAIEMKLNDVKPGDKLWKSFTLPTLKAAPYKIKAVYKGAASEVRSNTIAIAVGEGEEAKELGADVQTSKGTFTIRFFADDAPNTALHFVRQVKAGYYDGKPIFRLEPSVLFQTGDSKGDGSGTAGYTIKGELNPHKHVEGTVSMARQNHPDSGGVQFFVCLAPMPFFDGGPPPGGFACTAFGEVASGIDVVREIGKSDVVEWKTPDGKTNHKPAQPIGIEKASLRTLDKAADQKQ